MKKIGDFKIIGKERFDNAAFLTLHSEDALPEIKPGQFVEMRVDCAPHTYLRRPISIHDVDFQNNAITLLIQEIGEGTRILCNLVKQDVVNMIYPLGNGFTLPDDKGENVLLIGGGVGIAPMLYFGKVLKNKNIRNTFLAGFKTAKETALLSHYNETFERICITTNDGSSGQKGFVTDHDVWEKEKFDRIYACGPLPMMKAVAKIARERGVWCEVSLENTMACGIGACLCCVENTKDGNVCVCKDGPVFNINKLLW